jgi:hypothetical protein
MAGNIQADTSGDIFVEVDENNIIVVDPNKTRDNFGNIRERLVDHENLVMYANLEADVIPRTKLAVGGSPDRRLVTISVTKMNFLKPTKNSSLGTGYYDELTGENTTQFNGVNQPNEIANTTNSSQDPNLLNTSVNQREIIDTGLLGITSINVTTNTSFVPTVEILLEDVQGKGLFEFGDSSPYAAFFNQPYPPFYLTLKGYYGQAIRYQLNLETFHASFNGFSGNYQVRLKFFGFKFNILGEISMGHLIAAPHMYGQRFDITQTLEGPQQPNKAAESQASTQAEKGANNVGSDTAVVTQIIAEKGYQKIIEVYSEYKAKGLIPPNFPELTLVQLMNKLQQFEANIFSSFEKADVEPLTNIRTYKDALTRYFNAIVGGETSWFKTYLNPKPIVLKSGERAYVFKDLSREVKDTAISKLQGDITEFNQGLSENPTLGTKGTAPIPNPIKYDTISITPPDGSSINWFETVRIQTGISNPTLQDQINLKNSLSYLFIPTEFESATNPVGAIATLFNLLNLKPVPQSWFIFEGEQRFIKDISSIESQANKKLSEYESEISSLLLRKIEDTDTGIGFKPTVRNMIAVIMASAEGFIRLLDDVHTKAWDVKYDPIRSRAIFYNSSSAPSSDSRDLVSRDEFLLFNENQLNADAVNSQIPVYPWPQFSVESSDDKNKFELKYIADPSVVNLTQGYLFDKWPEVEFVEEYLRGLTQKFQSPISPPPLESERDTSIININPIEFPSIGLAYSNKEEVKFFYEIWERQFLTSHYSGFIRANSNQIDELNRLNIETETNNIQKKLGVSSPYLTLKLKNFNLNSENYPDFLQNISNSGTGRAYQDYIRDFFVTPYIKGITQNSFAILNTLDIGKIPQVTTKSEALRFLISNASNDPLIVDTLPYTDPNWCLNNLNQSNTALSNQVYNTNKSLTIFEPRKIIANFTDVYNYTTNRPVTNFSYIVNQNPYLLIELVGISSYNTYGPVGLNAFYLNRTAKEFIATEGYINGTTPTGAFSPRSTTSMLNTPYFINAIQNGVYNSRASGNTYPYVQAAYLFLNSLPLATLREKYKSLTNDVTSDLDYISSALKKFGAIHKLPYAWILKYGSIWHRYKKYKETNVDILESAWKNFDYAGNYYPPTSSTTETYFFKYEGNTKSIQLQSEGVADIGMQVGFYPKLINDLNVFYTGYDLYQFYTDEEIQNSVNSGMKLYNFSSSNINSVKQGDKNLRLITWSVLLPNTVPQPPIECSPNDNTKGEDYFVVPSFGTPFNQTIDSCVINQTTTATTKVDLTSNPNMYNGTVRCLWSAPNYGYFDSNQLAFPEPDSYLNLITNGSNQTPLYFLTQNDYTKIEEVFSVFEKKILDSFEIEFLNFCKPMANATVGSNVTTFGQSTVNTNANFTNFQSLFKSLMTVPRKTQSETEEQYFTNTINNQFAVFQNGIKSFMDYDIIFKYGNPSNYERRIFDSYLSHNNQQVVVSPIEFEPYVPNSLPQAGSNLTLSQSQINNREAWTTLETEVGFSTIPNVRYSSLGSYITDFFIDNNIEFSSRNITLLAPIIKMYATQKLVNPNLSAAQFQNQLSQYLQREAGIQDNFLNGVLSGLRSVLPKQQQLPERVINSVISGEQGKVEMYEVFKALNDKWIAGGDYSTKTLFEDFLFLDRASRNIGETIILDIFSLQDMFNENSLNQTMSVYTFITTILRNNNFTVMPLPAYVNFYGIQEVDGVSAPRTQPSSEFANNLWGTFLNVDYTNSAPKLVCFYVGKPSQYPNVQKNTFKFRSDGFDMSRQPNPLIENQQGKKDWALSNRCVGFNVDVGIRNQNIFYSMTVSQENGKATSESINATLDMSNQVSGRPVSTQNVSLYDLYKYRSYKSTITCLGNALLQPMMYFNLRHVPMFDGSYMITSVNHTIQPGSFQTTFDGTRQGYFDLPKIDNLLQSINQNLITKLEEALQIKKDQVKLPATSDNIKSTEVVQEADNTLDTTNSCTSKITDPVYLNANPGYVSVAGQETKVTPIDFANALKRLYPNQVDLQTAIYTISYIRTYQSNSNTNAGSFNGWNNNLGTLSLNQNWSGQVSLIQRNYSCVNIRTNPSTTSSEPIVHFESLDKYITFMAGRLQNNVERIIRLGLAKYYVCHWPKDNISEQYYDTNRTEFEKTRATFTKALASAKDAGLITKEISIKFNSENEKIENETTPGTTPTPPPIPPNVGQTCPPPVISTFSPSAGNTGTIVQVNGRNFESVKSIRVINKDVELKDITVFNPQTLRFTLPAVQIPEGQSVATGRISITTEYGTFESLVDFTFNPSLPNETSSTGGYADTTTQQQLSIPQQDKAGSNLNPQNNGVYPTEVTNQTKNPIGGDEELVVKVKPNIGIWKINSQPTMSYSVYTVSVGANNSIVKQERKTTKTPVSIVGFVSEDQQTFTCTRQKLIEEEFEDVLELYKNFDLRIETQIILSVVPEDKEKNPKDVTAPQTFVINVPPTTTEGLGRLTLVSDTNTERLPKFDGNSYYNIVKPNGGYYTYQFTPTDEIFVPNFETSTSPPIVNRISTKIFKFPQLNGTSFIIRRNSDTKYTNLIEVSDLGEFQLSITYTQSNIPNTTLTVTSNTFTL